MIPLKNLPLPPWLVEIYDQLREHGFVFVGDMKSHDETPESVKKKYDLTNEQWKAIPNRPAK